jgi:hypothetical protein
MADRIENLKALADEYSIRDPRKLYQLARSQGVQVTQSQATAALRQDTGRQLFAPMPRSLGKSAATAPGRVIQADLIDMSQNTKKDKDGHRYALLLSDVYTRELAGELLKTKKPEEVNASYKKAIKELTDDQDYSLSTDKGKEFSSLQGVIGPAVHRLKEPEDPNALAVLDRSMQTLKKTIGAEVTKKGGSFATHFEKSVDNYNKTPHSAVIGAPEDVEKKPTLNFRQAQINAGKFLHNRALTVRRLTTVRDEGYFRAPTNVTRSFKAQYGNVQALRSADSQFVTGANGQQHLLKQVQPVPQASQNAKGQLTTDRPLKVRLRSAADSIADFLSQQGGSMTTSNLEAVARRGVGLPGVFKTIRKNRTTLRNLLKLFPDLFKLTAGRVSLVTANVPAPVEVPETREQRIDRLFQESQARREEADRKREEKKRERLANLRSAYPDRPG